MPLMWSHSFVSITPSRKSHSPLNAKSKQDLQNAQLNLERYASALAASLSPKPLILYGSMPAASMIFLGVAT